MADTFLNDDEIELSELPKQSHTKDDVEEPLPQSQPFNEINFVDHFSIQDPSSTLRFRGSNIKIYDRPTEQFIIEQRLDDYEKNGNNPNSTTLTVKRMSTNNFGLFLLRASYTLVAILMTGFLFVACFQALLFIILNVPASSDAGILGAILALPLLLHGMGSAMAFGTNFVMDTWYGHHMITSMMHWDPVVTEWLSFIVFLGIPGLTMSVLLMAKREDWWEVSAITWMLAVFASFLCFCLVLLAREFNSCWIILRIWEDLNCKGKYENESFWQKRLRRMRLAMLLSRTRLYSGLRDEKYLVKGGDVMQRSYAASIDHVPVQTRMGLYSRLTNLSCMKCAFEVLDPPVRNYNTEDIMDIAQVMTKTNWGLEKMYCRDSRSRIVAAVEGESALTPGQVKSNLACTLIGVFLCSLWIIGVMVWLNTDATGLIVVALILGGCCIIPAARSAFAIYRMYSIDSSKQKRLQNQPNDTRLSSWERSGEMMYQVWETVTVTRPKAWYCWVRWGIDFVFFFMWPLCSLSIDHSAQMGVLFLFFGLLTFIRININPSNLMSSIGSLNDIELNKNVSKISEDGSVKPTWYDMLHIAFSKHAREIDSPAQRTFYIKMRMAEIVGKVSNNSIAKKWMWGYGLFAVVALAMLSSAGDIDQTTPSGGRPPIVQLKDFYYPAQPHLPYPACYMTKGFTIPGKGATALGDYAFMAALSYETMDVAQFQLDRWFGEGNVVDEGEFVEAYRKETDTLYSPVYYKLFSFPDIPGVGVVSIRGSETTWDFLVDAQLWSCAALAQFVRAFIPLGFIWTPILDDLVSVINKLEGANLKKISYYRFTTQFVNDLIENNWTYNNKTFHTLRVTGASLGGGLAIITGAQTNANAIAISGLNGMLSRHTFIPPVTAKDLNDKVFNIIPDRDVIAIIGDRARLFQEMECRAPKNNLLGCHSMWRSVCEVMYTCGSRDRSVLCRCVQNFGYPEPVQNGTRTFAEACAEEEEYITSNGLF